MSGQTAEESVRDQREWIRDMPDYVDSERVSAGDDERECPAMEAEDID